MLIHLTVNVKPYIDQAERRGVLACHLAYMGTV